MVFKHSGMTALAAVILAGMAGSALAQDTTTGTSPSSATTQPGAAMGTDASTPTATEPNPTVGYPADAPATTGTAVDGMTSTQTAQSDDMQATTTTTTTERATPTDVPDEDGGMDLGWLGLIGLAGLLGLRGRHDEHIRADNMGRPTPTR